MAGKEAMLIGEYMPPAMSITGLIATGMFIQGRTSKNMTSRGMMTQGMMSRGMTTGMGIETSV